jgi:hypothetical protein
LSKGYPVSKGYRVNQGPIKFSGKGGSTGMGKVAYGGGKSSGSKGSRR